MEPAQPFYNHLATHLALRLFFRKETVLDGELFVQLANIFRTELLFRGTRLTSLDTKRPDMDAKLNMGEFSERRWTAAEKKLRAGEYGVLGLAAATPDFPRQKIMMSIIINPRGWTGFLSTGLVRLSCSVSYLRHLASSPEKVEALLRFATIAWQAAGGGAAYGYANLALTPKRPESMFAPDGSIQMSAPPADRPHAIPIAYVGLDIDNNLDSLFCGGKGIKGAFWANYLSADYVRMAGGEEKLRSAVAGMRVDPLNDGGLLVVATDSPLPEDIEENRARFLRLHRALRPAFISREEASELKRPLLGYFFRERESIVP
jgi:hypothetical protein